MRETSESQNVKKSKRQIRSHVSVDAATGGGRQSSALSRIAKLELCRPGKKQQWHALRLIRLQYLIDERPDIIHQHLPIIREVPARDRAARPLLLIAGRIGQRKQKRPNVAPVGPPVAIHVAAN